MFQYQMFVRKEWKQLIQYKKLLLLLIGFTLYLPIINNFFVSLDDNLLTSPIFPLEFCHMLLLAVASILGSELLYSSMNEEFTTRSYEVLSISQLNKAIIILSKVTLPVVMGFSVFLLTFLINEILTNFTHKWSFTSVVDGTFVCFIGLISVFAALFSLYCLVKAQKWVDKQFYTAQVFMIIICIYALIGLYYFNFIALAFLAVGGGSCFLFYRIYYLLSHYQTPLDGTELVNVHFEKSMKPFAILCREASCHHWSYKKSCLYLVVVAIVSIVLNDKQQLLDTPLLVELVVMMTYIFLGNIIVCQNVMLEKRMHGFLMMRIAKVPAWKVILSRVLIPILLGIVATAIIQVMRYETLLSLSQTVKFLTLNIFVIMSLLVGCLGVRNLKYEMQYRLVTNLIVLISSVSLCLFNISPIVIFIMDVILILVSLANLKKEV